MRAVRVVTGGHAGLLTFRRAPRCCTRATRRSDSKASSAARAPAGLTMCPESGAMRTPHASGMSVRGGWDRGFISRLGVVALAANRSSLRSDQQLVEAREGLDDPPLHAVGDVHVPGGDRVVHRCRPEQGAALERVEHEGLDRLVFGRTLVDPGRHSTARGSSSRNPPWKPNSAPSGARCTIRHVPPTREVDLALGHLETARAPPTTESTRPRSRHGDQLGRRRARKRRTSMTGSPGGVVISVPASVTVTVLLLRRRPRCSPALPRSAPPARAELFEQLVEALEALLPERAVGADPVGELPEPLRLEVAQATAGRAGAGRSSPASSSTRRCLVMAGWLIGNGRGHVEHAGVAFGQPGQDRPPGGVGQGAEGPVELAPPRARSSVIDITIWLYEIPALASSPVPRKRSDGSTTGTASAGRGARRNRRAG